MFFRGGPFTFLGHGAAALFALTLAIPSLWKSVTQKQGLSVSLAIFLTYITQAAFYFFSRSSSREVLETFLILISIYIGLQWMPAVLLVPYEYLVIISHPLMTLLEGFSFMIVLLSFGQWLMNLVSNLESSDDENTLTFVKLSVLLFTSLLFAGSCLWIYGILSSGTITRTSTALLSSSITLFIVFFMISMLSNDVQMIITDPVLILLYLTYNFWIMSRISLKMVNTSVTDQSSLFVKWKPSFSSVNSSWITIQNIFQEIFSLVVSPFVMLYSSTLSTPLNVVVDQTLKTWSVEIILNFLLRISLFIIAPKLVESKDNEEEERIGDTLHALGKASLVLVYTHSGGFTGEKNFFSFVPNVSRPILSICESQYWRWANVYLILALYLIAILNNRRECSE